ncbi:retrovirus-related pol polyprotein from transposon TNT 1-94 [Tanacetum coccineum]|uniref:Retrovirus-related pol polyprotein from transposon TNT 1-94 n=1 Tax=Tanacetum coccineum TaxID=301880 RepID=A0ABQ5BJ81_9ASTR
MLVGIGKFIFRVDFIILDMPEDVKVPLILGRPFFSTAHAKIDVLKRKITLRVGDEKIIFKSVKPASSLIKRVYMLSLRERMELDLEARLMGETLVLNRSLDPLYRDYIELNDLNVPLELKRDQVDDLMPTIEEGKKIWMATKIKTWEILFLENHSAKLHVWKQEDEEVVSSKDEGTSKIKTFMAIAKDELYVGKADARSEVIRVNLENKSLKDEISDLKKVIKKWTYSKVTLDQLLSEQIPGNIIKALGDRGKRKEKISSKEVIFTKADESSSVPTPEITSDSKFECETQEPLPPLPNLIRSEPVGTSNSLISLADLTLNMHDLTLNIFFPKKTKPTSVKVSPAYVIKKKTKNKSPVIPKSCSDKKSDSSTKQLLISLMKEVKGLKNQIEIR